MPLIHLKDHGCLYGSLLKPTLSALYGPSENNVALKLYYCLLILFFFINTHSKLKRQSTTNTSWYVSIERLLRDRWHVLHRHDRQVHGRVLYDVCRRHLPDGLDTTGFPLLLFVFCFSISSLFCRFPLFV